MIRQRGTTFLAGLLAGLLSAGVVLLFISRPKRHPIQLVPPPTPAPLRVHVAGAVHQPGVYTLPHGSIWESALVAAGGHLPEADLERINLAAPVEDNQRLFIPRQASPAPGGVPSAPAAGGLVNVNLASLSELESLPGIGPALAQEIIEHRQNHGFFLQLEDLLDVSGIGPAKLEALRDLITLQ